MRELNLEVEMRIEEGKPSTFVLMLFLLAAITVLIALYLAQYFDAIDRVHGLVPKKVEAVVLFHQPPTSFIPDRLEERIKELQPRLDPVLRKKIVDAVRRNSEEYNLSPSLVTHLIWREPAPHFSPLSRSNKGAIGLMQVMYKVHKDIIPELGKLKPTELYHIDNNVKFGCMILRDCLDSTTSLSNALKCYVGGNLEKYVNDIFRSMAEYEVNKYK